jgi:hypothetical protein
LSESFSEAAGAVGGGAVGFMILFFIGDNWFGSGG